MDGSRLKVPRVEIFVLIEVIKVLFANSIKPAGEIVQSSQWDGDAARLQTLNWIDFDRRVFNNDIDLLFCLSSDWALYLLPSILIVALEDVLVEGATFSDGSLTSLFCSNSSSLALGLRRAGTFVNQLNETQRYVIIRVAEILDEFAWTEIRGCLEDRFNEPVIVSD